MGIHLPQKLLNNTFSSAIDPHSLPANFNRDKHTRSVLSRSRVVLSSMPIFRKIELNIEFSEGLIQ